MDASTFVISDMSGQPFSGSHYLSLTCGATERLIRIGKRPILIGRARAADITLDDRTVSGNHCRVSLAEDRVVVEDLGSTNGTFIDRRRVTGEESLPVGSLLAVGHSLFRHELLDHVDAARREGIGEDLERAKAYVGSLLPEPITEGKVRTASRFIPSAVLGGDFFGNHWLSLRHFVIYLLDVSGHGAGAALHSVSVANLIRNGFLPGVDFGRPEEVLAALNRTFPMEEHGDMYFTIWYGVYDPGVGLLRYACAGHPPALLLGGGRAPRPLGSPGLAVGMVEGTEYPAEEVLIAPGERLCLMSDGCYEVVTKEGEILGADAIVDLVAAADGEPERVEEEVRSRMRGKSFDDDFTLLTVSFGD